MIQNFTTNSSLGQYQNHGYEYLSSIYRMKEEHDLLSSRGITPYIMPVKVLIVACLAIEEYVNVAGMRVDPEWKEFDHQTESVKDRIESIYKEIGKPVIFDAGIWKDVVELFETKKNLQKYSTGLVYYVAEIPDAIKDAVQNYPIQLSQAIAERAIELLLAHSTLNFPMERVVKLV